MHSGDSACVLPPHSLGEEMLEQIRAATRDIALGVGVVGLMNAQYAIHEGRLYVIEANPRASRTVPFVSKAVGLPLAKLACRIMLGERIADLGLPSGHEGVGFGEHVSVKEAVLPVRPLRRRRLAARPGDALHRRGDGHRARLPHRVRQGPGRRRLAAAKCRYGLHHGHRLRQAGRLCGRPDPARQRLSHPRHRRHSRGDRAHGRAGQDDQQDRRGLPACRRLDRARRGQPDRQHPHGLGRTQRRLGDPSLGDRSRYPVPDHALRRRLCRARDRPGDQAWRARRALPAGAAPAALRSSSEAQAA